MTVKERFIQLSTRDIFNQCVICIDTITGKEYFNIIALPATFANKEAHSAYFRFEKR